MMSKLTQQMKNIFTVGATKEQHTMNTATTVSFGNIGRIDAVIRGVAALLMLGIVLTFDLGPAVNALLVLLSIPTMLFALMRWDPVYSLCDFETSDDRLRA
jgi:hypothetical protein